MAKRTFTVLERSGGVRGPHLRQQTIRQPIHCSGVGLHSGEDTNLTLRPAPPGTGILFVRTDLGDVEIPARYDAVSDTRLGTTLTGADGARVATVEHLMAALWGLGVDNAVVEIDGPEVPAMDGSAAPFVFLIECVGVVAQDAGREVIEIMRPIEVAEQHKRIAIEPAGGFSVDFAIAFDNPAIGAQRYRFNHDNGAFKRELGRARTFGFAEEVSALRNAGLARGGSLYNAVVIEDGKVLNEDGLRFDDEFVRHKVLDCLGDLYLAGAPLLGHVTASCTGHQMNNALLKAVFADDANWRAVPAEPPVAHEEIAALA